MTACSCFKYYQFALVSSPCWSAWCLLAMLTLQVCVHREDNPLNPNNTFPGVLIDVSNFFHLQLGLLARVVFDEQDLSVSVSLVNCLRMLALDLRRIFPGIELIMSIPANYFNESHPRLRVQGLMKRLHDLR